MSKRKSTECKAVKALRKIAMQYPETVESTSCNKAAFKARKKAFLYVGTDERTYNAMLKLGNSLAEAEKLAAKQPDHYNVGSNGWTKVTLELNQSAPPGLLERWIDESFRLLAPKKVVASVDAGL